MSVLAQYLPKPMGDEQMKCCDCSHPYAEHVAASSCRYCGRLCGPIPDPPPDRAALARMLLDLLSCGPGVAFPFPSQKYRDCLDFINALKDEQ